MSVEVVGTHITPERGWPYSPQQRAMVKVTFDNTEGTHIRPIGQDKEFWASDREMAEIAHISRLIAMAARKANQQPTRKIQSLITRMINKCYELEPGTQFQPQSVEVDGYKYP